MLLQHHLSMSIELLSSLDEAFDGKRRNSVFKLFRRRDESGRPRGREGITRLEITDLLDERKSQAHRVEQGGVGREYVSTCRVPSFT